MSHRAIHHLLKDGTRRRIIELLGTREQATYTEILAELGISIGKLNYHLRLLSPLLDKKDQGYSLNELGSNALALLRGLLPEQSKVNGRQFRILSWLLLSLSVVAMFYGFVSSPDLFAFLEFLSTALLIGSIFTVFYSGNYHFEFRQVLALSLVGLAYGGIPAQQLASILLYMWSNPFHADLLISPTPILNSLIFFPTLFAWSLRTRREWAVSAITLSSISLGILVIFTARMIIFGHLTGFFSSQTLSTCSTIGGGIQCSSPSNSLAISLQPILLLLAYIGRSIGVRTSLIRTNSN